MAFQRRRFNTKQKTAGEREGWRSGLEEKVLKSLQSRGAEVEYEPFAVHYSQPQKPRRYTPDFLLENGIIVETKGRFVTADRQKHILIKLQHPLLDIRFVFSNPNQRISKLSSTTYAMWCEAKGFKYAGKDVPDAWLAEDPESPRLIAAAALADYDARRKSKEADHGG